MINTREQAINKLLHACMPWHHIQWWQKRSDDRNNIFFHPTITPIHDKMKLTTLCISVQYVLLFLKIYVYYTLSGNAIMHPSIKKVLTTQIKGPETRHNDVTVYLHTPAELLWFHCLHLASIWNTEQCANAILSR